MGLQYIDLDNDNDINIDWKMLHRQKKELVKLIQQRGRNNILWGLVEFIDCLEDWREDCNKMKASKEELGSPPPDAFEYMAEPKGEVENEES